MFESSARKAFIKYLVVCQLVDMVKFPSAAEDALKVNSCANLKHRELRYQAEPEERELKLKQLELKPIMLQLYHSRGYPDDMFPPKIFREPCFYVSYCIQFVPKVFVKSIQKSSFFILRRW